MVDLQQDLNHCSQEGSGGRGERQRAGVTACSHACAPCRACSSMDNSGTMANRKAAVHPCATHDAPGLTLDAADVHWSPGHQGGGGRNAEQQKMSAFQWSKLSQRFRSCPCQGDVKCRYDETAAQSCRRSMHMAWGGGHGVPSSHPVVAFQAGRHDREKQGSAGCLTWHSQHDTVAGWGLFAYSGRRRRAE